MSHKPKDPNLDVQLVPARLHRFRLIHLLYVMTLLAASLATFGGPGLILGVFCCTCWAAVFTSAYRPHTFLKVCGWCTVLICLIFSTMIPMSGGARSAARRVACSNNLKQLALALDNYHSVYGSYPPAYIADQDGVPMHSWRVLILPYLNKQELYDQYNFDEPWDGPNNSKLLAQMPEIFACPTRTLRGPWANTTSYAAVVAPDTAWPGASSRSLGEIPGGYSQTLLLLECSSEHIPWMAPRDLSYEAALELPYADDWLTTSEHKREDFFSISYAVRGVAFVDGSVGVLGNAVDREAWQALLTINESREGLPYESLNETLDSPQPKIGNRVRLGIFILLNLLPLPWVWINPTSGRQ